MPEGGTLRIETTNVDVDGEGDTPAVVPGRFVRLTISDTGTGMDEPTRAQAFEPFFTTKDVGRGTGLGLSTVYGIIEQSGGAAEIESSPGHGTSVVIYMPQAAGQPAHEEAPAVQGDRGTILLVEDDEPVRALVSLVLPLFWTHQDLGPEAQPEEVQASALPTPLALEQRPGMVTVVEFLDPDCEECRGTWQVTFGLCD